MPPAKEVGADLGKGKLKRKEGQEDLEEVVDELKNDLRMKEVEFEELKLAFERLEKDNDRLREKYHKEKESRQVIEVKLQRKAINQEIEDNFQAINDNVFFEQKRSKLASMNHTLYNSINEQYRMSLRNSFVAKYAKKWLHFVQQRKKQREEQEFFKV